MIDSVRHHDVQPVLFMGRIQTLLHHTSHTSLHHNTGNYTRNHFSHSSPENNVDRLADIRFMSICVMVFANALERGGPRSRLRQQSLCSLVIFIRCKNSSLTVGESRLACQVSSLANISKGEQGKKANNVQKHGFKSYTRKSTRKNNRKQ